MLFPSSWEHYSVNKALSTCTISLNSHSNPMRRILCSQLNREVNWSSDRWSDLPKVTQKISDRLRLKPRSSYFKSRDLSTHHSCIGRWDIVFLTSILEYKVNGDWAGKCVWPFRSDKQETHNGITPLHQPDHPLSPGLVQCRLLVATLGGGNQEAQC